MKLAYAGGYETNLPNMAVQESGKLGFWDIVQSLINQHGANVVIVFLLCVTVVLCFFIYAKYIEKEKPK